MSYDLIPKKNIGDFTFGAFSFPVLLEACNYLFPVIHDGGRWFCAFGIDPRMPKGDDYPRLLSNDGFPVTAEEAKIMARIARNFVAIQRLIPGENTPDDARGKSVFKKEDVEAIMMRGMFGGKEVWPVKVRVDFTDKIEAFADWAEKSGGFKIT